MHMYVFTVSTKIEDFSGTVHFGKERDLCSEHTGALEDPFCDILQAAYVQWTHAELLLPPLPVTELLSACRIYKIFGVECHTSRWTLSGTLSNYVA